MDPRFKKYTVFRQRIKGIILNMKKTACSGTNIVFIRCLDFKGYLSSLIYRLIYGVWGRSETSKTVHNRIDLNLNKAWDMERFHIYL